jgi:hypothetical protein
MWQYHNRSWEKKFKIKIKKRNLLFEFLKKFVLLMWKLTLGYDIEEHTSRVWPEVWYHSIVSNPNP